MPLEMKIFLFHEISNISIKNHFHNSNKGDAENHIPGGFVFSK